MRKLVYMCLLGMLPFSAMASDIKYTRPWNFLWM